MVLCGMSTNIHYSRPSEMGQIGLNLFLLSVLAAILAALSCWVGNGFDPQRKAINDLTDEVVRTQGNLALSLTEVAPPSGAGPIREQEKADEAFFKLQNAVEVTPSKYVSHRARQLVKDGPRRLVR